MDLLVAMGFEEEVARSAMERTGGDVNRAVELLLNPSDNQIPSTVFTGISPAAICSASNGGADSSQLVSLPVSQYDYSGAGTSACTAIASNIMKYFLFQADNGGSFTNEAGLMTAITDAVSYCQTLPSSKQQHLAVDELGSFLQGAVNMIGDTSVQGLLTTPLAFQTLFDEARSRVSSEGKHIGIVITKPPETVCVILPPTGTAHTIPGPARGSYVFFDSHSRPHLGHNGAYLVVSHQQQDIIRRLELIFTPLPTDNLDGGGGSAELMQQMYNMFEGYIFQSSSECV